MFEPISNEAKKRLEKSGIILFKSTDKSVAKTMVELSVWDTCPYHIYYSVNSDSLIHLFACEIVVTKNFTMARDIRLPNNSDLATDEPMMIAMAECFLSRLKTWTKRLGKRWALADSCLPHFNIALDNTGFKSMKVGSLANDEKNECHRGRNKVGGK
ncbi:hypothetical protein DRN34_01785 [Thermococci archaeon]|nr:MAG: hypothetical protein DRN34_01785 [Thermococci archaeon]